MSDGARHVAVLKGGLSAEREVSLSSGQACANALRESGYRVSEIDAGHDVAMQLAAIKPDVVFNALHGRFGEDGCVQGILEVMSIPYTHSGVLASALAMNKAKAKVVLQAAGLLCPQGKVVSRHEVAESHVMRPPYVVKPVREGSSVGVFIIGEKNSPPASLKSRTWDFGEDVLVEEFIPGRELTCAVLNERPLDVIEIQASVGFYDYKAKYAPGGSRHILPAPVHRDIYVRAQEMALIAHKAIGCRGATRTDFRYDDSAGEPGRLFVLEVNTQPGMTKTSLLPEMAQAAGISFPRLVTWLVEDASCNR
jgi:D-alanine-D-alanine ligase